VDTKEPILEAVKDPKSLTINAWFSKREREFCQTNPCCKMQGIGKVRAGFESRVQSRTSHRMQFVFPLGPSPGVATLSHARRRGNFLLRSKGRGDRVTRYAIFEDEDEEDFCQFNGLTIQRFNVEFRTKSARRIRAWKWSSWRSCSGPQLRCASGRAFSRSCASGGCGRFPR
jgi:hypothetical protein